MRGRILALEILWLSVLALVARGGVLGAVDALGLSSISLKGACAVSVTPTEDGYAMEGAGEVRARIDMPPDAFLCRLEPSTNTDVVQLSAGRVNSLRCNAVYSPTLDEARVFEASHCVIELRGEDYWVTARAPLKVRIHRDFMKKERGVKWFRPLDKSVFKRAPAGWCSWYIYWQGVTEQEVVKNTRWLAENLKQFGCEFVQIDDGWQGVGHGSGENRDWYVTEVGKFPHGMRWLAGYIRGKGLRPGIWVIPFSTSNEEQFRRHPELFIRRPDGTSIGETKDESGKLVFDWTGRFIVDPTGWMGRKWFQNLFHMLCVHWGYDYVKIDGQGGSRGACETWHNRLVDPSLAPDEAYRTGLDAIKSVMGPRRFLLNCGGQLDSCGYCEGIRTGGDVGPSWQGMQPAIRATFSHLFRNNICFWTDPDVVCVRPKGNNGSSLTFEQSQMWATLLGITGQLLMASDKMYDLPDEYVELYRRIFPVADIRPMDLYPLAGRPRVFDLRVSKPGVGQWDVVALFNWSGNASDQIDLEPADLGLPAARYVFYDVWQKRLLGVSSRGLRLFLPPTSCRVLTVRRFEDHPQLLGTSRHLTQGADDLLAARWDPGAMTWSGRSLVVGGDPYELRFSLPPGWTCRDPAVTVDESMALLTLNRPRNGKVQWSLGFCKHPGVVRKPAVWNARVRQAERAAKITWEGANALGYRVYRDGKLLGYVSGTELVDHVRRRGQAHWYEVSAVGWRGESPPVCAGKFVREPLPRGTAQDVWLDQLRPDAAEQDWGQLHTGRSVEGNPLRIAGKEYRHGLGTHARSEILYRLDNRYAGFTAEVGVDDEKGGAGSVSFQVFVDGDKLFDSGVMKGNQPAQKVSVSLEGAEELRLVVTDGGDGINCDHADWAEAKLIGNK